MASVKQVYDSEKLITNELNKYQKESGCTIEYIVSDCENETEALAEVRATAPIRYKGLVRTGFQMMERMNPTTWKIQVEWLYRAIATAPDEEFETEEEIPKYSESYDFTMTTERITNSKVIDFVKLPDSNLTKNFFNGDIGRKPGEDNAEGVDKYRPVSSFKETHFFTKEQFTNDFARKLMLLRGTVNEKKFRYFKAGEVLYIGANVNRDLNRSENYQVIFNFLVQPNEQKVSIGEFEVITKKGWEYLWAYKNKIALDDKVTEIIEALYLHKIYESSDFSELGIGS